MYKKIKSEFIRNKLKDLKWSEENREYIQDLTFIEKYALGEHWGLHTGYDIMRLENGILFLK